MVDPDGMRTLYVGESGAILSKKGNNNGLVNDPLPDAITIIPREKELAFLAHFTAQSCGDPTNGDNAAQYRAYGVSYDVGSIKQFLKRNENAPDNSGIPNKEGKRPGIYYYKDATGNYKKVGKGESRNYIFSHQTTPYILGVIGSSDHDEIGTTFNTYFEKNNIGGNIKGWTHRHVVSKTTKYYTLENDGINDYFSYVDNETGYGPSSGDISKSNPISGFCNITYEVPNSNLYFYNKNGTTITIPLSIFK